jgi:hypothetical protein
MISEKAIATVAFVAGAVLSAIFLPNEPEMPKIFLALLSAIYVLPPVAKKLGI